MDRETWYNPQMPKSGGDMVIDLHDNIWSKPDHSPGAAINKCSGNACQQGAFGEPGGQ
jgi:hypothetical protein